MKTRTLISLILLCSATRLLGSWNALPNIQSSYSATSTTRTISYSVYDPSRSITKSGSRQFPSTTLVVGPEVVDGVVYFTYVSDYPSQFNVPGVVALIYDPTRGTWREYSKTLSSTSSGATVVVKDGIILYGYGDGGSLYARWAIYDPLKGNWIESSGSYSGSGGLFNMKVADCRVSFNAGNSAYSYYYRNGSWLTSSSGIFADFYASSLVGTYVWFVDESIAPQTATWAWDFGDGSKSSSRSVYHAYARPGVYSVVLKVTNGSTVSQSSQTVITDFQAPTGSVVINGSAASTFTTLVNLNVAASDDSASTIELRISNDNSTWSAWQPLSPSVSWALRSGLGLRSVYVQFRDRAGNVSASYSDYIQLNQPTPFELWQAQYFTESELSNVLVSGSGVDLTLSGHPNFLRFALGFGPRDKIPSDVIVMSVSNGQGRLRYRRPATNPGVFYTVEMSRDLITWSETGVTHELLSSSAGADVWEGRAPQGTAIFFRLRTTLIPVPQFL